MNLLRSSCITAALLWCLAPQMVIAQGIVLAGPDSRAARQIHVELSSILSPRSIDFVPAEELPAQGRRDIILLMGQAMLQAYCDSGLNTPAIAFYIYAPAFLSVLESCPGPVSAVFSDASVEMQMALSDALFPNQTSAIVKDRASRPVEGPAQGARLITQVDEAGNVNQTLGLLLRSEEWSALILTMNNVVYSGSKYRTSLETLYRNRKGAIAPIKSLLSAGATGAVYFDRNAIVDEINQRVRQFQQSGTLAAPGYPQRATVALNHRLLRTLFGRQFSEADIAKIEDTINE